MIYIRGMYIPCLGQRQFYEDVIVDFFDQLFNSTLFSGGFK